MNWGALFFLLWLLIQVNVVLASDPVSLRLRQARTVLPTLHVYFDVLDTDGQSVREVRLNQMSATVGEHRTTVEEVQRLEQTNEGIAYIFLVDISKSLTNEQFQQVRIALKDWAQASSEKDRVALITFGARVKVIQDFTAAKPHLQEQIENLHPTDDQTQLHQGLLRAMELANRADADLPRYRVIVTLSDGKEDYPGGVTRQEVLDRMQEDRVPIYALGLTSRGTPVKNKEKDKAALETLGAFARTSGGEYLEVGPDRLETSYDAIRERIRQVFVARLTCSECPTDSQARRVQVSYSDGTKILPDGLTVRVLPQTKVTSSTDTRPPVESVQPVSPPSIKLTSETKSAALFWIYGGAVALILSLVVGAFRFFRQEESAMEDQRLGKTSTHSQTVTDSRTSAQPAKGVPIRLTVIGRQDSPQRYEVDLFDQVLIGRSEQDCRVTLLEDGEVSARHCALVREQEHIFVQDLDSKSGTMVNGVPITGKHRLQDDDLISIGKTSLRFSVTDERAL
jgi:Mg-chelatase subunit ChlD